MSPCVARQLLKENLEQDLAALSMVSPGMGCRVLCMELEMVDNR